MTKQKHRIVYLDDDDTDRKRYKEFLETDNRLEVVNEIPSTYLDPSYITKHHPSLVIIDYLLDAKQSGGKSATYKGSTLSAVLREKLPYTPLVLLTRGSLIDRNRLAPARDLEGAFDHLLIKKDVSENTQVVIEKLLALIEGFQTLRDYRNKDWPSLRRALAAEKEEYNVLMEANPPRDLKAQIKWRVPQAAKWIRSVLIGYPGILLNSLHSATLLGIQENDFLSQPLQRAFRDSHYSGVFSAENKRWWKRRILFIANTVMARSNQLGDPALNFAPAWKKTRKSALKPSVCVYSGKPHADCVCFVLKKPVLREYSLPYIPDNRPSIMSEARCSFKAIRESNDFDPVFVREDARPLIKEIQKRAN